MIRKGKTIRAGIVLLSFWLFRGTAGLAGIAIPAFALMVNGGKGPCGDQATAPARRPRRAAPTKAKPAIIIVQVAG
jgi:hypothetical protein